MPRHKIDSLLHNTSNQILFYIYTRDLLLFAVQYMSYLQVFFCNCDKMTDLVNWQ